MILMPRVFVAQGQGVAYGLGRFVAAGAGGNALATSSDGVSNWIGLGLTVFTVQGFSVAFGNGRFVAGGDGTSNTLAYSDDGLTFSPLGSGVIGTLVRGVAFGGGLWIAVGQGAANNLATSPSGTAFTGQGRVFSLLGFGVASGAVVSTTIGSTTTVISATATPTTSTASACGLLPSCTCLGSVCTSTVSVVSNATLSVSTSSTLTVQGSVTLTPPSTLIVTILSPPTVPMTTSTSSATVNGTLQLIVGVVPSGSVTVLQATSVSGTFGSVQTSSSSPCSTVTSSPPVYSPTTITVSFQTTDTCRLSIGAIIGIAVGSFVVVVLIALIILVPRIRRLKNKREAERIAPSKFKNLEMSHYNVT